MIVNNVKPLINTLSTFSRRLSVSKSYNKKHICIVGAGPAGFYAAQYLAKKLSDVQIDLLERLPVPFGLVRYGVAPDHPEVKNVINTFTKTAENPSVRFLGNIELGKDVSLKQLRENYHAVLLTYGAEQDRNLGVPGENLSNLISAREFVGWYNGDPKCKNLQPNLQGSHVVILGQGNVGMDVARIILTPVDQLKCTDITSHAIEALSKSKVKKVSLIGRRGPLQAAFTIKELREMLKIPGCKTIWRPEDFQGIDESLIDSLPRPKKRITELMLKSVKENSNDDGHKNFCPIFHRSPIQFKTEDSENGKHLAEFIVNRMESDKALPTTEKEVIDFDFALRSIGYKSVCADPSLHFDFSKGYIPNKQGRVVNVDDQIEKGLYVGGWLRTGPTGVILTTMSNAFEVAGVICKDFEELGDNLGATESRNGFANLNLKQDIVDWKGWEKIDSAEKLAGKPLGKPREKLLDIKKMLEIAI